MLFLLHQRLKHFLLQHILFLTTLHATDQISQVQIFELICFLFLFPYFKIDS